MNGRYSLRGGSRWSIRRKINKEIAKYNEALSVSKDLDVCSGIGSPLRKRKKTSDRPNTSDVGESDLTSSDSSDHSLADTPTEDTVGLHDINGENALELNITGYDLTDSDNSASDAEEQVEVPLSRCEKIANWATENNIKISALSSLMDVLRDDFPEIPKDPRTLLKTATNYKTKEIEGVSRVNVYLTFRMLLYFRISNSVMLSSDNGNILIIGFSFQGTVLNVFFSVFNVIRYNSNGIL